MSKRKPVELYRCNDRYWFPAWLARSRSERLVSALPVERCKREGRASQRPLWAVISTDRCKQPLKAWHSVQVFPDIVSVLSVKSF